MRVKVWVTYFLFILLFIPAVCVSSEDNNISGAEETKSAVYTQSKETVGDLLMFWEEKNLFVQSSTRNAKPISQVAENMTVITAKDIEDMNAHTVDEVLNRVTGLFVDFGNDFGGFSLIQIQGSAPRHVLVLLDGVAWNFLGDGSAQTISIPVRIIQRIEVIKGPASSSWGSSLGGVINIITKETGKTTMPAGTLSASYGGANSQYDSAEIFGKAGPVGYYLFAGRQDSDGLRGNRFIRDNSLYSKFSVPVSSDVKLGFTTGYSEPRINEGDFPSGDLTTRASDRSFFATASLDAIISKELSFNADVHMLKQKFLATNDVLGMGFYGPGGDLFQITNAEDKTIGGNAKLIWTHGINTAVLGMDVSHGRQNVALESGPFLQSIGAPGIISTNPGIDKWAIFANDTIVLSSLSITPGIRYDHNNISGSFTSPSLGATYRLGEHTILRAAVARGFTLPPLSSTSGGGLFLDPNPSLKPEKVWSYQTGIEASVTDYLWVKATAFYHDLKDNLVKVSFAGGPPGCSGSGCNDLYENMGNIKRKGAEIEVETIPFYNLSLKAGFAYANINPSDGNTTENYAYNIGLKYYDRKSFMAQLFGHYVWWNLDPSLNAKYNAFIWDLNASKKIYSTEKYHVDIFAAAHNIFNGSQYTFGDTKNPGRWAEAGLRMKF